MSFGMQHFYEFGDFRLDPVKRRLMRGGKVVQLAPKALDGPIEAALAASDDFTLRLAPTTWRSWAAPIVESPERWFLAVDA